MAGLGANPAPLFYWIIFFVLFFARRHIRVPLLHFWVLLRLFVFHKCRDQTNGMIFRRFWSGI